MERIPFVLFGDGPRAPTGLARIARDLAVRCYTEQDDLGIRFAQVGIDDPGGWHWQGWDFYGFQPTRRDYGRTALGTVCRELEAECGHRAVVLCITDPARVYDLVRDSGPGDTVDPLAEARQLWGYFPIDAINPGGAVGGPAKVAVQAMARVHAYGAWGASVLQQTLRDVPDAPPVSYLPHGIDTRVFCPLPLSAADALFQDWYAQLPISTLVIGAVATNQPRKDLGTLFAAAAHIRQVYGQPVAVWLHTDLLTGQVWDVGQLAYQFGFTKQTALASTAELPDTHLAARYTASHVTFAPGLGEGFGYPIVESLSCGTPVVHVKYGGGVAHVPHPHWLVEPTGWRLESVYVQVRPVLEPEKVGETLYNAALQRMDNLALAAFCRGSVSYLDWQHLWPRWRSWITHGLHGLERVERPERVEGAAP